MNNKRILTWTINPQWPGFFFRESDHYILKPANLVQHWRALNWCQVNLAWKTYSVMRYW